MFGSLKKKLKSVLGKFSGKGDEEPKEVFKEEPLPKIKEAPAEHVQEKKSDIREVDEIIQEKTDINVPEKAGEIIEEKHITQEDVSKKPYPEKKAELLEELEETDKKLIEKIDSTQEELEKEEDRLLEEIEDLKKDIEKKELPKEKIMEVEDIVREDERFVSEIEQDKKKLDEIKDEIIEEKSQAEKAIEKPVLQEPVEKELEPIKPDIIEEPKKPLKPVEEKPEEIIISTEELVGPEDKKVISEPVIEETFDAEKIVEKKLQKLEKPQKEKPSLLKRISEKTLTEDEINEVLDGIKNALLENDVAYEVVDKIYVDIKNDLVGKSVKRSDADKFIEDALKKAMTNVLNQERPDLEKMIENKEGPFLIVLLGFNGTGKTTTTAKLANRFKKYRPVIAAGDTFRAASIEQLEIHAKNLGVDLIKHRYGADSAAVIFDAMKHAQSKGKKLVLADTAGRSHSNVNLMDELKKVCKVNKPDLKILVLDALTGNDIYEQAKRFDDAVGVDAIILSKTDVYEKGGAALSASYTIKKPVLFLGTGQEYKDLEEFDAEKIVKNLLG